VSSGLKSKKQIKHSRKRGWPRKTLLKALKRIENLLPPLANPLVFTLDLVIEEDVLLIQLPNGNTIPFPRNYFALTTSRKRDFWLHILSTILDAQFNENAPHIPVGNKKKVGAVLLSLYTDKLDVTIKMNKNVVANILKV